MDAVAQAIRHGGLVAFPTDTVYGVGADASSPEAVGKLYAAKSRPRNKPLPVLLADAGELPAYAASIPRSAGVLAERFWPGPLTIVLPRTDLVCPEAVAGGSTVALRLPDSEVARSIIRASGVPMAVTSANPSGGEATVNSAEVLRTLGPWLEVLVQPSRPASGVPSTVVDLTVCPPRLVRQGAIAAAEIEDALEGVLEKEQTA